MAGFKPSPKERGNVDWNSAMTEIARLGDDLSRDCFIADHIQHKNACRRAADETVRWTAKARVEVGYHAAECD